MTAVAATTASPILAQVVVKAPVVVKATAEAANRQLQLPKKIDRS